MTGGSTRRLGVPRSWRAGTDQLVWNRPGFGGPETLRLASPSIGADGSLPIEHAGRGVGDNVSPALEWSGVPPKARALWLVVQDPDAPVPRPVVHLSALLPPTVTGAIGVGALNASTTSPGVVVLNGWFGTSGWQGPRPVPGHGPHAYVFQLFALDIAPSAGAWQKWRDALRGCRDHVIARGRLQALYERP